MLRGALYGSIGAALGLTWPGLVDLHSWLWMAVLLWPFVLLLGGPLLVLAAVPVQTIQRELKRVVGGRVYFPLAVCVGTPFGVLVCFVALALLGKSGTPWTDPGWTPTMPGALAAGAGLGFGCVRDILDQD